SANRARTATEQRRMRDEGALDRGGSKARSHSREGSCRRKDDKSPAGKDTNRHRNADQKYGGPDSRFLIDRKIDDDAASERDAYPGDQPTRADFCESPSADAVRGAAGQLPARIE